MCTGCRVSKSGTVTGGASESICASCEAGTYLSITGAIVCTACAAGKFKDVAAPVATVSCGGNNMCGPGCYSCMEGVVVNQGSGGELV